MIEFEYDPHKSELNKDKHGIDFLEAQSLWKDQSRLVIPAQSPDEDRYALIAMYKNKHWSAFYTVRNHRIRLISVRRSRKEEVKLYES